MSLRNKMRRWVLPFLQDGEQAHVVFAAQDRFRVLSIAAVIRALLALLLVVAAALSLASILNLPSSVGVGVGSVLGGLTLIGLGPTRRVVARTDRSLCVFDVRLLTGRPRRLRERLPLDLEPVVDLRRLVDHVALGRYDLRVARRFRQDVRQLGGPQPAQI